MDPYCKGISSIQRNLTFNYKEIPHLGGGTISQATLAEMRGWDSPVLSQLLLVVPSVKVSQLLQQSSFQHGVHTLVQPFFQNWQRSEQMEGLGGGQMGGFELEANAHGGKARADPMQWMQEPWGHVLVFQDCL